MVSKTKTSISKNLVESPNNGKTTKNTSSEQKKTNEEAFFSKLVQKDESKIKTQLLPNDISAKNGTKITGTGNNGKEKDIQLTLNTSNNVNNKETETPNKNKETKMKTQLPKKTRNNIVKGALTPVKPAKAAAFDRELEKDFLTVTESRFFSCYFYIKKLKKSISIVF